MALLSAVETSAVNINMIQFSWSLALLSSNIDTSNSRVLACLSFLQIKKTGLSEAEVIRSHKEPQWGLMNHGKKSGCTPMEVYTTW